MRWLLIALFVSLVGLLMAAAGVARHIWLHRARTRSNPSVRAGETIDSPRSPAEKAKAEAEK
jgi:hypothetical protein